MWNGSIDERLPPHSRKPYHLLVPPTIIHVFHHPECQKGFPNAPILEALYNIYMILYDYIYMWFIQPISDGDGFLFGLPPYATNTS